MQFPVRSVAVLAVLAIAGFVATRGDAFPEDAPAVEPVVISEITDVSYVEQRSFPPNLVVTVKGLIHTGGYTDVQLTRIRYTVPPSDGIQDYVLTATPPDGPAIQVEGEVVGRHNWRAYTEDAPWVKGLRVHGAGDGIVVKMFDKPAATPGGDPHGTDAPADGHEFEGLSKSGDFQEALNAAIAAASKHFNEGAADIQFEWKIQSVSGLHGGITGEHQVRVTITAQQK